MGQWKGPDPHLSPLPSRERRPELGTGIYVRIAANRSSVEVSLPIAFGEPAVSIKARQYGDLFRRYIVPQMPLVVTLGTLLFISLGLQLVLPLIVRHFIDEAQKGAPVEGLPPPLPRSSVSRCSSRWCR